MQAGYYVGGTLNSASAYEQGYSEGSANSSVSIINSLYAGEMTEQTVTVYSGDCFVMHLDDNPNFSNIWASDSKSFNETREIPLMLYNESGEVTGLLNTVQVTCAASTVNNASASNSYVLKTANGAILASTSSSATYNLFGMADVNDGSTHLTINGTASISASIGGRIGDYHASSSCALSYKLQYVRVSFAD